MEGRKEEKEVTMSARRMYVFINVISTMYISMSTSAYGIALFNGHLFSAAYISVLYCQYSIYGMSHMSRYSEGRI